ncbi:hypothetical protein MJO28_008858 [Puccinia striiformis f. sp. tritici]|uniref:Uncharacterized protein n=1 Tax=Puccinia striiformis f. sp. tritici TaxID=168172 RepID=A0ACC0EDX5_9BASI|nr:hypothetical protein MJO28_008858 [Puccinia striiformis f. sp. tritici]
MEREECLRKKKKADITSKTKGDVVQACGPPSRLSALAASFFTTRSSALAVICCTFSASSAAIRCTFSASSSVSPSQLQVSHGQQHPTYPGGRDNLAHGSHSYRNQFLHPYESHAPGCLYRQGRLDIVGHEKLEVVKVIQIKA